MKQVLVRDIDERRGFILRNWLMGFGVASSEPIGELAG